MHVPPVLFATLLLSSPLVAATAGDVLWELHERDARIVGGLSVASLPRAYTTILISIECDQAYGHLAFSPRDAAGPLVPPPATYVATCADVEAISTGAGGDAPGSAQISFEFTMIEALDIVITGLY